MRRGLLVFLVVSLSLCLNAQIGKSKDFKFEVGTAYKKVDAEKSYFFNKSDDLLAVKMGKKGVVVQKFEAYELKQITEKEYKDFPKGYSVASVEELAGVYYMFYSVF